MSEPEPPKRLVGWKQYVGNVVARVVGRSLVRALFACGLLSFGFAVFVIALWSGDADINAHPIGHATIYLLAGGLLGVLFILGLWGASVLLTRIEKIEPVELITRHNTGHLPEVETLVRSSEQPVAEPVELLRAAGKGHETSPEQLLRPGEESRQDV